MQVTADEVRQHYTSLSDEELLQVDPADLTEFAPKIYEQALTARSLKKESRKENRHPSPDAAPEECVEPDPDWLENAACPCSYAVRPGVLNPAADAERARDVLLAAGIPCQLAAGAPDPENQDLALGEWRVLVPSALNLKAISVLDKEIFNPELEAEWRTHFALLSDDELDSLRPDDLCAGLLDRVDRLTRAHKDEIARRKDPDSDVEPGAL
jgi:hypothetical protein